MQPGLFPPPGQSTLRGDSPTAWPINVRQKAAAIALAHYVSPVIDGE